MPPGASPPARRGRSALGIATTWVVLAGLYVLFVGSFSLSEAIAGSVSAALGCAWWVHTGGRGDIRFPGGIGELRPLGTALLGLPGATLRVASELAGTVARGSPLGTVGYRRDAGSAWARADEPGERALGLVAASLAPDSFVLREDAGDSGILDHRLVRDEVGP
jgi:hypothetical protein